MTRLSKYRTAVLWIAENDEPGSLEKFNPNVVQDYISVQLVAVLFEKSPMAVAFDVIRERLVDPT